MVAAVGSGLLIGYFIYAFLMGMEPITTVLALGLLCIFLVTFVYLVVYPDSLRSQYTERRPSAMPARTPIAICSFRASGPPSWTGCGETSIWPPCWSIAHERALDASYGGAQAPLAA